MIGAPGETDPHAPHSDDALNDAYIVSCLFEDGSLLDVRLEVGNMPSRIDLLDDIAIQACISERA
jgi:hypothetical protein